MVSHVLGSVLAVGFLGLCSVVFLVIFSAVQNT